MRRENAATVKAVVTGMVLVGVLLAGTRVFAQDKYAVITANKNDMIICACFNPASKVQSMEIQIAHFVNGNPNVIDTTNGNLLSLKEMHADQYAPAGDPDHPANSIYACRAIDTGMADVDFPQLRCTLSVMNSSEGAIDSVLLTPHQDQNALKNAHGKPAQFDRFHEILSGNSLRLEGILWVSWTGAPWRALPSEYPPYQTCHRRMQEWVRDRVFMKVLRALAEDLRERGKFDLQWSSDRGWDREWSAP